MNANKVIHEAMGLCWHILGRLKNDKAGRYVSCDKCDKRIKVGVWSIASDNPDYTDPVHYCALMDWMREGNNADHLDDFRVFMRVSDWLKLSRQEQINLIAEAIETGALVQAIQGGK